MVQVGLNTGPRNARVLGWAKSFTKDLSSETMTSRNEDVIGAVSIVWALLRAAAPTDVTDKIEEAMEDAGVPNLSTDNVHSGGKIACLGF